MGYVFYISKQRINEMLSLTDYNGSCDAGNQIILKETKDCISPEINVKFPFLEFLAKTRFGSKKVLQFSTRTNNNYLKKLLLVINKGILNGIKELNNCGSDGWFFYEGQIIVCDLDLQKGLVSICAIDSHLEIQLIIDCSLCNFSEFVEERNDNGERINMQNLIHSGNRRFFINKESLSIKGVFHKVKYDKEERKLYCIALFMYKDDEEILI